MIWEWVKTIVVFCAKLCRNAHALRESEYCREFTAVQIVICDMLRGELNSYGRKWGGKPMGSRRFSGVSNRPGASWPLTQPYLSMILACIALLHSHHSVHYHWPIPTAIRLITLPFQLEQMYPDTLFLLFST
jgi:hypothetical protein